MRARLALILALALISAAPASAGDFVGMYNDDAFFGTGSYRSSVFAAEAATGVQLVRQPFDWKRIEIAPDEYDFRTYDDFVLRAAVAGIRVLPVVGNPPSFRALVATSGNAWSPPRSNTEFAAFAARLVQRYGPGGAVWAEHPEVPSLPIHSWQVWNEPNLIMMWYPHPDPAAYTALLRAAFSAIHGVDPQAEVVAAGLPQSAIGSAMTTYVEGMFSAGAKGAFDTFAVHAYAPDAAGSLELIKQVRELLTAQGDNAPIWVTEVGWPTGGRLSRFTVTEAQQAVNLQVLISALGVRRAALGIRGFAIFRWRDAMSTNDSWPLYAGLVRADGSLKAGLDAFRSAVAALSPRPSGGAAGPPSAADIPRLPGVTAPTTAVPRVRIAIRGGELSRYGFLRVHVQCVERACAGALHAGRWGHACSGRRGFALSVRGAAVLRLHLRGTRRQLRRCRRILVTADTGPADPPAAAYLPTKAIRYTQ